MPGDFARAIRLIDEANARDPNTLVVGGEARPKELAHAELLTAWVQRLRPDAGEALLLAARAQHLRRWEHPRASYPDGRSGYLRWRIAQQQFHATETGKILSEAGYDAATIERVQLLIQKKNLGSDPEVQALEDGLCLVFLETQFDSLGQRVADEKMVEILRKTWRKMSPDGRAAALSLNLTERQRAMVALAAG
jgi:hypothetical protein